jgi:excisionase family DNA binding protein
MKDVATIQGIPGYVDIRQAAEIIGVSYSQACRYVEDGILTVYQVGSQRLVRRKEAESFERPPKGNPAFRRENRSESRRRIGA